MCRFDYIITKLEHAPINSQPFPHIYLEGLFNQSDFEEIISLPEIKIEPAVDDSDLFGKLYAAGYKIIDFPGCIVDQEKYLGWHRTKERGASEIPSSCEGFGMTLRLMSARSPLLAELSEFLVSVAFNQAIASRFGIKLKQCTIDGGIQKYLDGYEISPHPDTRRKAATFMVNINSHKNSEATQHHTHYLKFKPDYKYVQIFWEKNKDVDRCWVPWDWCDTQWMQPTNNSIVIFSPTNATLHAVKADYDHLQGQRTQLYGNLWYKQMPQVHPASWEDLTGGSVEAIRRPPVDRRIAAPMLRRVKRALSGVLKPASSPSETAEELVNYYSRDL